jgi:hypothetical protein
MNGCDGAPGLYYHKTTNTTYNNNNNKKKKKNQRATHLYISVPLK